MRVLVTGAGGFVGGVVAARLTAEGHDVIGTVRETRPRTSSFAVVQSDLSRADALPSRLDAIIHCAALLPSATSDQERLYAENVCMMQTLLTHATASGVAVLLNCSSMSVYGPIEVACVTPETPTCAADPYGRAKLEGERLLTAASGLATLSLRLPGVVGAGSHHNFLSTAMAAVLRGKPVVARNPQAPFNNIMHSDDLAAFFAALLKAPPGGRLAIPIAAIEPAPLKDVLQALFTAAGRTPDINYQPSAPSFLIDPEPARALGFKAPPTLDAAGRFARDCVAAWRQGG